MARENQNGDLIIYDAKGEGTVVSAASVKERRASRLSPMPANLHDTISDAEFRDMLAYLLSLR